MSYLRRFILLTCVVTLIAQIVVGIIHRDDEMGCKSGPVIIPLYEWLFIDAIILFLSVALYTWNAFKPRNIAMEYGLILNSIVTIIIGGVKLWSLCTNATPPILYNLVAFSIVWHSLFVLGSIYFALSFNQSRQFNSLSV